MSPAPQGNLEVERYIGSCLISQRLSSNNSVKNSSNIPGRAYYSKGKANDTVENRGRTFVKQHNLNQRSVCEVNNVGGPSRYPLPGGLPMPADCNGYANAHYGHHRLHSGGSASGGWTGLPLISMTTGNPRRGKKVQQLVNHTHNHRPVKSHQQCNVNSGNDVESQDADTARSPLTRLAIHTQGAPLIQAGRYNHNRNRNNYNRDPSTRLYQSGDVRKTDVAKNSKSSAGIQNKDNSTRSSDSLSVASDESSGNSENSLPRIIKPRKRRKKDRKPPVNQPASDDTSQNSTEFEKSNDVSPIVTLKPYMPLCYESFGARATSEQKPQDLSNEKVVVKTSSDNDKSVEDLINRPNSVDEFPFGNLLDEEDDARSDLSCAPATLCQCRYCDPSGVIWDVDQRCYSPFLTPPSPTDNRFQFSNSLPVYYDSTNQNTGYFNQPISPSFFPYSFEGDLGTILRRSWSDPSSNVNFDGEKKTNVSSSAETLPSSPQGLQVSSEIVTSPNGHRDIEIKFYSSAIPLVSSKSTRVQADIFGEDAEKDIYLSAVDKDVYDRLLFVAEE